MEKLVKITGDTHITRLLRNILARNFITIDDTISTSEPIEQTNGVLQGDPLSPLLFIIATAEIPEAVTTEGVKIYIYADDMVLLSQNHESLQTAFNKLAKWASLNDLALNETKTVQMTFRKGGKPANSDAIRYGNKALANVSHFKYLGITLQASGKVYTKHIKDRLAAAMIAINCIKNLHRISLNTALTLFQLKVMPIMTYGLDIKWEHLTKGNLEDIERVKATLPIENNTISPGGKTVLLH